MSSEKDPFFHNDVLYMHSLLGKSVEIKTVDEKTHVGIVYVIDPIFKNVVLTGKDTDYSKAKIVFLHAIKSFTVTSDQVIAENFLRKEEVKNNPLEFQDQKERIKKWLNQMQLKVEETETGDLKVDQYLTIVAPYTSDSCLCDSTIILRNVRKIIETMPADF